MSLSNITLSAGVRSNLLNLQNTADLKNTTQERLSTGKKVNSALDNPSNYFTASALSSRANDLSNLLDGISNGIQVLQAATNGIDAITSSIESLQSTVQQARSDKSFQTASYTIDSATIGTATAKTLSISGGSLASPYSLALNTTGTPATQATTTSSVNFTPVAAGAAAHQAAVTAATTYTPPSAGSSPAPASQTAAAVYAGNEFVGGGGTNDSVTIAGKTITFDGTTDGSTAIVDGTTFKYTAQEAVDKINHDLSQGTPSTVTASVGTGADAGKIVLTNSATGTASNFSIDASTTAGGGFGTTPITTTNGADAVAPGTLSFSINGTAITLNSTTGDNAADAVTAINSQLSSSGITASVGTGANAGKLVLTGAADGSNSISVTGTDAASVFGTGANASDTGTAAGAGSTLSFSINGTAISLDSTTGDSAADAVTAINSQLSTAGVTGITASVGTGANAGKLVLTGAADGSNSIAVTGTGAAAAFGTNTTATGVPAAGGAVKTVDQLVTDINTHLAGKVKATNDGGKLELENDSTTDLSVTGFNSTSAEWDGSTGTTTIGKDTVRTNLVDQFNQVKDQLDKIAGDSGFNGINLLAGDALKLTFNETSTSSLTIQSAGTLAGGVTSSNLGITEATDTEFGSDDQLDARLTQLSNSLTTLRSQSSAFGSNLSIVQNRQDFTKNMINTLQVGSDNLTLADTNEEGANLLALNTRQQLETTSLSFASQADQAVLQFLR